MVGCFGEKAQILHLWKVQYLHSIRVRHIFVVRNPRQKQWPQEKHSIFSRGSLVIFIFHSTGRGSIPTTVALIGVLVANEPNRKSEGFFWTLSKVVFIFMHDYSAMLITVITYHCVWFISIFPFYHSIDCLLIGILCSLFDIHSCICCYLFVSWCMIYIQYLSCIV